MARARKRTVADVARREREDDSGRPVRDEDDARARIQSLAEHFNGVVVWTLGDLDAARGALRQAAERLGATVSWPAAALPDN